MVRIGGKSKTKEKRKPTKSKPKSKFDLSKVKRVLPFGVRLGEWLFSSEGVHHWGKTYASTTLKDWREKFKHKSRASKHQKIDTPRWKFTFPNDVFEGELDNALVQTRSEDVRPIKRKVTHRIGGSSKFFDNLKKTSKPRKFVLEKKFHEDISTTGWHSFSCAGFNRTGVFYSWLLNSSYLGYENLQSTATTADFLDLWNSATNQQEVASSMPVFPDGAQKIMWGISSFATHHTYMNANQFFPLNMTLYLLSPREDTDNFPIEDWYNPVNSQYKTVPPDTSRLATDTMNNRYSFPIVYDHLTAVETAVVKGATPFLSEKFEKQWRVLHVYKIRLKPGQNFELEVNVRFNNVTDLKRTLFNSKRFIKDTTVIPMVTFYGEPAIALDQDTSVSANSVLEKSLVGSAPSLLLHESIKYGSIHCDDNVISDQTEIQKSPAPDFNYGYIIESREIPDYTENVSCSYAEVNSNLSVFNNPVQLVPGNNDPTKGTAIKSERISIKVATEEMVKPAGSIPQRESQN